MKALYFCRGRGDFAWWPFWIDPTALTARAMWKLAYRNAREDRNVTAWAIKWAGKLVDIL